MESWVSGIVSDPSQIHVSHSSSCAHALSVLCCLILDSTLILTCHDAQAQAAWVVMWVILDSRGTRDRVGAAVVEVWAYLLTAHTMAGGHAI